MITGTVVIDLTDAKRDRMRNRAWAAAQAPTGARVVLNVGALAVEPEALCLLQEHADRLTIDVHGTPFAVQRWVHALRHGLGGLVA